MPPAKKTQFKNHQFKRSKHVCLLALVFCAAIPLLISRNIFSADSSVSAVRILHQSENTAVRPQPEDTPPSHVPPQTTAERLKTVVGEARDFSFAQKIESFVLTAPEIASAQIKNPHALTVSGLKIGETILMISDGEKRVTFVVEVTRKPAMAERQNTSAAQSDSRENAKMSGSVTTLYAQSFDENPSLIRQNLDFQRKLSNEKTLRVAGEMFKFIGGNDRDQTISSALAYGLNRLSIGVDSPDKTIDFLDSQIQTSPLSFNNFTMRGFHLTTNSKNSNPELSSKGIEVFAGLARPSLAFYDGDSGKIVGATLPVASGEAWQLRAGLVAVAAEKNSRASRGGTIFQTSGVYAPNKKIFADAELAFANGGISWRARLDLKFRQFGAYSEIVRFDRKSPLNSIGAQPGGRESEMLAFYWRPERHFNFSANYNHTQITRLTDSRLADFNRSIFSANATYRFNQNSRLNFRFLDEQIETAVPGGAAKFQIATRAFTVGHNIRFNQNWTNNFEARMNFSRETRAAAELENGFNLSEQLRFSVQRNSLTGFFNYTDKTPSLASLIFRNPQLLPPLLQTAFVLNPAQFLQVYRDRLDSLLYGFSLPQTRSLDAGLRFQSTVSRFILNGEARYASGEILAVNQKNLYASIGVGVRLDAANSLQINAQKSFGGYSQTAITFSFTHRFGRDAGDGFQFSKLFGLDKGRVQGRVFYDLNGNGRDDDEPGIAGMTVQLTENRSVKTDSNGRYEFSANEGRYNVAFVSEELGVRLRASTATQQLIALSPKQKINVNFGVIGFGVVSGHVFNDLNLSGEALKTNLRGLKAVKIILRKSGDTAEKIVERTSDSNGFYEFRNLPSGEYALEVEAATLPANFRLPAQTTWKIKVEPLQEFYFDIPVAAQRAVAGFVFFDKDGDGKFNPQKDEAVEGAIVTAAGNSAVSDGSGAYILRNLSAGQINLSVRFPNGTENSSASVELGAEPITKRSVNLIVRR